MNWKAIIGAMALLLSISCSKEDVIYVPLDGPTNAELVDKPLKDAENNILKDFSDPQTKVTVTPIWVEGDLITVYSIDDNNKVIFIDTCAVYDVGNVRNHRGRENYAKITAEVAKECKGYFAAYPFDILNYKVGDAILFPSDRNFGGTVDIARAHLTGEFGDASLMTGWCNWCDEDVDGHFNFRNRVALLQVNDVAPSDLPVRIKIEDGIDVTINTFTNSTLYFPIISEEGQKNDIDAYYKTFYHKTMTAKSPYAIGHIYPISLSDIRLTSIYIEGKGKMRPSQEERFYCYGVIGDNNDKIDLSRMATWSMNPANAGAIIIPTDSNPGIIFKKEAAFSTIVTAKFENYIATFNVTHGK